MVNKALVFKEVKKSKKGKIGHKDWWNRSCTKKKREVKRKYRRWRARNGSKKAFIEQRKRLRELLVKKRKEKREEVKELRNLKNK